MFSPNKNSKVGITQVKNIKDKEEIRTAFWNLLALFKSDLNGYLPVKAKVLIKVNLCLLIGPETGATVDPFLVKCLCDWLLKNYEIEKIYIAESDATHLSADLAFKVLGWDTYFIDQPKIKLLNLSKTELVPVNSSATYFSNISMPKEYMEADCLISFAKLKTHTLQKISCILKNQFGAIPEKIKIIHHPNLEEAIVSANAIRIPDFCIVDGIIAMEGHGPVKGIPKPVGLIIVGTDPVATDHLCAKVMGFNPRAVPHLNLARKRGIGTFQYTLVGDIPNPLNFKFKYRARWKEWLTNFVNLLRKISGLTKITADE